MSSSSLRFCICSIAICLVGYSYAETTTVAVATNFYPTAKTLNKQFSASFPAYKAVLVAGSTGQLFAQISMGAPFDVFLAADTRRVDLAIENKLAVAETRFTYAVGRLALVCRLGTLPSNCNLASIADLKEKRLVIANPDLAPYGSAAVSLLRSLDVVEDADISLVRTENVSQALSLVLTGNAQAGLVAYPLAIHAQHPQNLTYAIPSKLHLPIKQDAVLLRRGTENLAAIAFMEFMQKPETVAAIANSGYSSQ